MAQPGLSIGPLDMLLSNVRRNRRNGGLVHRDQLTLRRGPWTANHNISMSIQSKTECDDIAI